MLTSLPNLLTYGRILAVPALAACFLLLRDDTGRWAWFTSTATPISGISTTGSRSHTGR